MSINQEKPCGHVTEEAGATPDTERVGYGYPPKNSRFKPGQSGNPSGRPKDDSSLSFIPELVDELQQICGQSGARVTNKRQIVKGLIGACIDDPHLTIALISLCEKHSRGRKKDSHGQEADPHMEEDENFAEKLAARESQVTQEEDETISAPSTKETEK